MRTIAETLASLPPRTLDPLAAPVYRAAARGVRSRVMLAVESMRLHTSDEGAQLQQGFAHAGYVLHGHDVGLSLTDVCEIMTRENPGVVVVQDQREWDGLTADRSRNPLMRFHGIEALRSRHDVFTLTVIKDAQNDPAYHRASAETMGAHGWICYYHPAIIERLAPYVRRRHLIRTYHTIDAAVVPEYSPDARQGCLLSGAVSGAYPLRSSLVLGRNALPMTTYLPHPGYRADGCRTPEFLATLARHKVAICTSSRYGYALRKLIEATAAGCVVITDLPTDEVLPEIDGNLVRVRHDSTPAEVGALIARLCADYDPRRQREFAAKAVAWYDYRDMGVRLAGQIESLRRTYP